jgi:hypothetical protein
MEMFENLLKLANLSEGIMMLRARAIRMQVVELIEKKI